MCVCVCMCVCVHPSYRQTELSYHSFESPKVRSNSLVKINEKSVDVTLGRAEIVVESQEEQPSDLYMLSDLWFDKVPMIHA